MNFYRILILIFSVLGLANGGLIASLFRLKRFYLYALGGAAIAFCAVEYYIWYALAYDGYGDAGRLLAYIVCGILVMDLMILVPMILLSLAGCMKPVRKYAQALGTFVLLGSLFIGVYGSVDGTLRETTEHHDIYVDNLPKGFEGFTFAQITDTHIGPYYRTADLAEDLDHAKAEGAEAIMLTGDLIDDLQVMPETEKLLVGRSHLFPDGILYVRGNHEFHKDPEYIEQELRKTPVRILNNSHVEIMKNGAGLYVAGVDYPEMKGEGRDALIKEMVQEAFAGIPENAPILFLAHHPDFINEGFVRHAFLTLTGHTHGGQTGLDGKPLMTPFTYMRGMYSDGTNYGYVSRGNGGWFPSRFGCSRELAIFTLHRKA